MWFCFDHRAIEQDADLDMSLPPGLDRGTADQQVHDEHRFAIQPDWRWGWQGLVCGGLHRILAECCGMYWCNFLTVRRRIAASLFSLLTWVNRHAPGQWIKAASRQIESRFFILRNPEETSSTNDLGYNIILFIHLQLDYISEFPFGVNVEWTGDAFPFAMFWSNLGHFYNRNHIRSYWVQVVTCAVYKILCQMAVCLAERPTWASPRTS